MAFGEMQIEVQDETARTTEHFNSSVGTSGTTISAGTNRPIQLVEIYNPSDGPLANSSGDVLLVSWDSTNYSSIPLGGNIIWPGKGYGTYNHQIHIKAEAGTINYEIRMIS